MSSQPNNPTPLDLDAIRARLADAKGPEFWRSLEQVAGTEEFQAFLDNEFTPGTSEWSNPLNRRRMLELMGASLGLAGLTACTKQPPEKIVPYVAQPEDIVPGKPLFFASALPLSGYGDGVLVESHMGRPTKIEGNPEHPSSLGSTGVYHQAAALGLYDPDRSQAVLREGRNSTWQRFQESLNLIREELLASKGAGFRILTETVTSPLVAAYIREFLATYPEAKWHQYEPVNRAPVYAGTKLAFGEALNPVYHLDKASVVVALDSDFLTAGPGAVRYARDFATRRQPANMNRLYAVEPTPSLTGAMADHRLALNSADVDGFARALAAKVGAAGFSGGSSKAPQAWVDAVAADLAAQKGASLVVAGEHQPAAVHAIAAGINAALGNVGSTVTYHEPPEADAADQTESLAQLVADMDAGKVATIFIGGGNPIYTAPPDLKFSEALRKVKLRLRLAEYDDETSAVCHWQVPMAHALESWGDLRAFDGTVTLQQPLIAPLYEGKTIVEVIAVLLNRAGGEMREVLKTYWAGQLKRDDFETFWEKCKHDGMIAGSAPAAKTAALAANLAASLPAAPSGGAEVVIRPCPSVYDGRYTNNAWLQELPRPLTKITWDNAVILSPKMADSHKVQNGDILDLKAGGRSVKGPAWILPGQAEDTVTVHMGYGRTRHGKVSNGVGFDAGLLRSKTEPWRVGGATIGKTGDWYELAITHNHHSMEGRDIVRIGAADDYQKAPDFAQAHDKGHTLFNMYPEFEYKGRSWGMAIDLNACTGCNACTIACQAENNISVVGRDQVIREREMHWIRVDRYFEGSLDEPAMYHQPVPCMHCDNAPCENVCPVAATSHSEEGLNQMTYNRCVGTRYCSNNCPYKVRRFNFFLYADYNTESFKSMRNPDVSVRSRGVMEKCTYCVQRINLARIDAEREDREIRDGEVITACQAVCPTQAIHFGDMNDASSKIAKAKKDPRNYGLLAEINTRPRTTYLAKLRNPNPEIEKLRPAPAAGAHHG
ncbi:MAG: TAT-variant-translocated molybdopterin oxidoreductase [Bryobacteraceae bacterium]